MTEEVLDALDHSAARGADLDPLGDAEVSNSKNRAKVSGQRPNALLYSSGVGAIVDLPNMTVMPAGLDAWDKIYARREHQTTISEPRLLDVVRGHLGPQVEQLRPFPWQPTGNSYKDEGKDLGVPARVFPQWLRCTGCDRLARVSSSLFTYKNTNPFRPDQAGFTHEGCLGRSRAAEAASPKPKSTAKGLARPAVPARFLLVCANGHVDEFPYVEWVHRGEKCAKAAVPSLKLQDLGSSNLTKITCLSCKEFRFMNEAYGPVAQRKLPRCRARHPHLDWFDPKGCSEEVKTLMIGAANLWFSSLVSTLVLPRKVDRSAVEVARELKGALYASDLATIQSLVPAKAIDAMRALIKAQCQVPVEDLTDEILVEAVNLASSGEDLSDVADVDAPAFDQVRLLDPEWRVLSDPGQFPKIAATSEFKIEDVTPPSGSDRIVAGVGAVNKLKKVNALIGFTRIDALDRISDQKSRVVPLRRTKPEWVPATEDRGEGIFIRFDEETVAAWEKQVEHTVLWERHQEAHRRNWNNRQSETAQIGNPDDRFPPPRFWAVHTFSHALIRQMTLRSGYSSASIGERLYAWKGDGVLQPAAGVLISTTAPDSEGTLGGLVALSDPAKLGKLIRDALLRASRCSSDPVCGQRVPHDPEDFLHGAACHCCLFNSETSCQNSNRFLDRRFLVDMPASSESGGEKIPSLFQALLAV